MDITTQVQPQPIGGILQLLVDSLGAVEGVDLFNGPAVPLSNDASVAQLNVIAYGGVPPQGTHNEGYSVLRKSTFQVIGRHEDYDKAFDAAESARVVLSVHDVVLRGLYFIRISQRTELTDLPFDPQRRARVAFSVETVSRLPAADELEAAERVPIQSHLEETQR